jgi:hypothetical protein
VYRSTDKSVLFELTINIVSATHLRISKVFAYQDIVLFSGLAREEAGIKSKADVTGRDMLKVVSLSKENKK